jgi:tetraacyldisaccharide 4'-kinase
LSLAFLQRVLAPVVGPLVSPIYGGVIARKNRAFDAGKRVVTLDRPVISVGNLSTGGTGKTPTVTAIVKLLASHGHKPCIAMRGFGAPAGQGHLSDEAREYARTCEGVPIVAQPNRTEGLLVLFASEQGKDVDVVVLDDGFQHRQIARQLDIVLIDATRSPFEDALLPAGNLREPTSSLRRAQIIIITRSDSIDPTALDNLCSNLREQAQSAHICTARHAWHSLMRVAGAEAAHVPPRVLESKKLALACAIGNPQAFLAQASRETHAHIDPQATLILPDHDPYEPATIARLLNLSKGCDALLLTAKDWVKLTRVKPEAWPCPVYVPELSMKIADCSPAKESEPTTWQQIVLDTASLELDDDHASE